MICNRNTSIFNRHNTVYLLGMGMRLKNTYRNFKEYIIMWCIKGMETTNTKINKRLYVAINSS